MAIDPSIFHQINVADTCSVWNILSSKRLYAAAIEARCEFCITGFVNYECLIKPRTVITHIEKELINRLNREQAKGQFQKYSCTIEDLQEIKILESRRRLGKGELSSIVFSMKIGEAFITDDRKAQKLARTSNQTKTQSTPHLLSWLFFKSRLSDGDIDIIIKQHEEMGQPLAPHFKDAYEQALQCKLNIVIYPEV